MATPFWAAGVAIPSGAVWAPQSGKSHGICSGQPLKIVKVLEMLGEKPSGLIWILRHTDRLAGRIIHPLDLPHGRQC
jgi:hypothetical protein